MYVGKTNQMIFENLFRIVHQREIEVYPRIPLIPGITATEKNLRGIVDLLCEAGANSVALLPYNPMGIEMYSCLGRPRPPLPDRFMKPDEEQTLYAMFTKIIEEKERPGSTAEEVLPESL